MAKLITATDMIRSFSDIIGRVYYKHETFDIKKGNNIVATLAPAKSTASLMVSNLNDFFAAAPKLDAIDIDTLDKEVKNIRKLQATKDLNKWD